MKREKAEYVVFRVHEDTPDEFLLMSGKLGNKADCEAWIRKHGDDGFFYQKGTLLGPVCRVAIEHKEIRRIRPAVLDDPAEEGGE